MGGCFRFCPEDVAFIKDMINYRAPPPTSKPDGRRRNVKETSIQKILDAILGGRVSLLGTSTAGCECIDANAPGGALTPPWKCRTAPHNEYLTWFPLAQMWAKTERDQSNINFLLVYAYNMGSPAYSPGPPPIARPPPPGPLPAARPPVPPSAAAPATRPPVPPPPVPAGPPRLSPKRAMDGSSSAPPPRNLRPRLVNPRQAAQPLGRTHPQPPREGSMSSDDDDEAFDPNSPSVCISADSGSGSESE